MRVRHLQSCLRENHLVQTASTEELRGASVGVDGVHWLRILPDLKDPAADALGGITASVQTALEEQLKKFAELHVVPYVVFQGTQPRTHALFSSQLPKLSDEGWQAYVNGDKENARTLFAKAASSRSSSDLVQYAAYFLKSRGVSCFQAPQFAGAQLSYFSRFGMFDVVVGPPSLLLYGVPRVVTNLNFAEGTFEWLDLRMLLEFWEMDRGQFLEACLFAGTEYCLTYPYLNLKCFQVSSGGFSFKTAVDCIKTAPLFAYLEKFPDEKLKAEHSPGYSICRTLIEYPVVSTIHGGIEVINLWAPILDEEVAAELPDKATTAEESPLPGHDDPNTIPPTVSQKSLDQPPTSALAAAAPVDFHKIVGAKLPPEVFSLMGLGALSRKVPSALAFGIWTDSSHPAIDTVEYREALVDLRPYRCRMMGLLATALKNPSLQNTPVKFHRYSVLGKNACDFEEDQTIAYPDCSPGLRWEFTREALVEEQQRQSTDVIGIRFCLAWHHHNRRSRTPLCRPRSPDDLPGDAVSMESASELFALVHFKLLEALGHFEDGSPTTFGTEILDASASTTEDLLFVVELLKFGLLSGDPLQAPPDRPFPKDLKLFRSTSPPEYERSLLLLSRVASLVHTRSAALPDWTAELDFDLAAMHCVVRTLKRALRQMTEACCSSVLLADLQNRCRLLPGNFLCPGDSRLPYFSAPRNCVGIAVKFFLECDYDTAAAPEQRWGTLVQRFRSAFPQMDSVVDDLARAFLLWAEVLRLVHRLTERDGDEPALLEDMLAADEFLRERAAVFALKDHPKFRALLIRD
eukprot:Polyplicarium_translucidae@DN3161_c0_g1_i1.p1